MGTFEYRRPVLQVGGTEVNAGASGASRRVPVPTGRDTNNPGALLRINIVITHYSSLAQNKVIYIDYEVYYVRVVANSC